MEFFEWFEKQNTQIKFLLATLFLLSVTMTGTYFVLTAISINQLVPSRFNQTQVAGIKITPVLNTAAKESVDKQVLIYGTSKQALTNEIRIDFYRTDGQLILTKNATFTGTHFRVTLFPQDFEQPLARQSYYARVSSVLDGKEHFARSKDFSYSGVSLANIHYYRGIENLERKGYRAAIHEFRISINLNPDYSQAKTKLDQVKNYLENQVRP